MYQSKYERMPLRILKASAGSGKTFTLTETYIRYCLDERYQLEFSNILAITFTNKASAEMKDRILGLLYTLSQEPDTYPGIDVLQEDLQMSLEAIQHKCNQILHRILEKFDLFTITTIDSFFTRLYGSMTLDLFEDIPRDITFDDEKALEFAADQLISSAQKDPVLQKVVIDLLDEKIREGEGVGLKNSLTKLGKELFNDEFLRLREHQDYTHPASDIHQALTTTIEILNEQLEEFQSRLDGLIRSVGLSHSDFAYSFTRSLVTKDNLVDLHQLSRFVNITNPEKWFTKGKYDEMMERVSPVFQELLKTGQEYYDFVETHYRKYATYQAVLNNYGPYRVLRFLKDAVQDYLTYQRQIFLSDINLRINQKISDDDAMIVYEKLGQRIRSIMIDEFQDTSQIQWDNLKPLIRNNLAEGYPNLVVGDVKQAIYRFRNGNWEIMEIQVPEFKKQWLESNEKLIDNLKYNWRSSPDIVSFNNDFFAQVSQKISDLITPFIEAVYPNLHSAAPTPDHGKELKLLMDAPLRVYELSAQQVPEKNQNLSGYVKISHTEAVKETPKEEMEMDRMEWLRSVLEGVFKDGYQGSEIGILARGRKEMAIISDYLTRWSTTDVRFRFTSEDSLRLELSDGVQLLIAALKIKSNIDVTINQMVFCNYYIKLQTDSDTTWTGALPGSNSPAEEILKSDLFRHKGIEQLALFLETVVTHAGLTHHQGQWPYLIRLIEEVKKFELRNGPDVPAFLEEWEHRIREVKIQMSEDSEKIRLFTIHKSKGLEFDVVILPYGEWKFEVSGQQDILWVQDQSDEILKLAGPLPVNYSSDLLQSAFGQAYLSEYLRNVMDNINLLYVAMTRPRHQLYIRLQDQKSSSGKNKKVEDKPIQSTIDLFRLAYPDLHNSEVSLGQRMEKPFSNQGKDSPGSISLEAYFFRKSRVPLILKPGFDGTQDESIGQGLVLHDILESLKYDTDIPAAVARAILDGIIRENERAVWIDKLESMVNFLPVRDFYKPEWKVYNEKSIMTVEGFEYRPDRIQENGQEYVVLDYKTGKPASEHHHQIRRYKSIVKDMVSLPVRSFIYYLNIPKLVEVQ